jgi:hypothetical protein
MNEVVDLLAGVEAPPDVGMEMREDPEAAMIESPVVAVETTGYDMEAMAFRAGSRGMSRV